MDRLMRSEFQDALRQLDELRSRRAAISEALAKKVVKYTGPDRIVTVTVELQGPLRSITFAEAERMDSRRLAESIGSAINGARDRAQTILREAENRLLPQDTRLSDARSLLDPGHRPIDFNRIGYDGPVEARNRIAECMERIQSMVTASDSFANKIVHESIGHGMGRVEMTVSGEQLIIQLDPDSIRSVGLSGLGEQIVAAANRLEVTATRLRMAMLQKARTQDSH